MSVSKAHMHTDLNRLVAKRAAGWFAYMQILRNTEEHSWKAPTHYCRLLRIPHHLFWMSECMCVYLYTSVGVFHRLYSAAGGKHTQTSHCVSSCEWVCSGRSGSVWPQRELHLSVCESLQRLQDRLLRAARLRLQTHNNTNSTDAWDLKNQRCKQVRGEKVEKITRIRGICSTRNFF